MDSIAIKITHLLLEFFRSFIDTFIFRNVNIELIVAPTIKGLIEGDPLL